MTRMRLSLIVLATLAAALHGCASSGSGNAIPTVGAAAQDASGAVRFGVGRIKIKEFSDLPLYSGYYFPDSITSGPKKSLWVTDDIDQDSGECAVVQIATSGTAVNTFYYSGPISEGSSLGGLTTGPDGNLWIPDYYNEQILKMTPEGAFTSYPLNDFMAPIAIAVGRDHALWFTERSGGSNSAIGRMTIKGKYTKYAASGWVYGIAAGPDGALWYTEETGNKIGRITTHGEIEEFSKGISAGASPLSIAAGPDGALWFSEATGGRIGRITTSGKVTEYSRGITPTEEPFGIAAGPDNAMWFTEYETFGSYQIRESKLARITMAGKISDYSKGLSGTSGPGDIVAGPDGNMWFVETYADRTGRLTL